MPQIGLGTWLSPPGEVEHAVEEALKVGYRHIDAAVVYQNQVEVAEGIKRSGVPRSEIFLVSKLWNNSHRPELVEAALDHTLKELNTTYLDLYLVHWPVPFPPGIVLEPVRPRNDGSGEMEKVIDTEAPSLSETWKAVVKLLDTGKVRTVGVSNFTVKHLEMLAKVSDVIPAVNQIEAHPLLHQLDLIAYCKEKGIHLTAYSPLGNNITGKLAVINHSAIAQVAEKVKATPAQVLIAWAAQKGYSVIPKSVTAERIKSNFIQIELDEGDMKTITALGEGVGYSRGNLPYIYNPRWDINIFDEPEEANASRSVW